jgi:prepilin-type N-terminal cleavage/methylation domain-containing protein
MRLKLSDERGMTLVELLVTMVIGMIVMSAATTLITSSERASKRVQTRVDATQRGRTAMDQITQRLRSMTCLPNATAPVVTATADSVTFYGDLDGDLNYDPEQWRLYGIRDGAGNLTGISEESGPVGGTPTRRRAVVTNIKDLTKSGVRTPLFRYYAYPSASSIDTVEIGAGTGVAAIDLRRVARMDIAFKAATTDTNRYTAIDSDMETSVYARTVRRDAAVPTFDCTG